MNKKAFVFLCAFFALMFALAACGKRTSPYGAVIVDKQGMEHVIMTDANGVTVIDSEGDLVAIMTDSDSKKPIAAPTSEGTTYAGQVGEYETHAVTFPGILQEGSRVEDRRCYLTMPEGWEQIGRERLILRHLETDARITILSDMTGSLTGALRDKEEQLAKLSPEFSVQESTVTIDGLEAYRTQYDMGEVTQISYLMQPQLNKLCRINCSVPTDKLSEVDVDAVLQTLRFKNK